MQIILALMLFDFGIFNPINDVSSISKEQVDRYLNTYDNVIPIKNNQITSDIKNAMESHDTFGMVYLKSNRLKLPKEESIIILNDNIYVPPSVFREYITDISDNLLTISLPSSKPVTFNIYTKAFKKYELNADWFNELGRISINISKLGLTGGLVDTKKEQKELWLESKVQ